MQGAVLITGGAKRVGADIARFFAAEGYDIALHYNNSEHAAQALQQELKEAGVTCHLFCHDLTNIVNIDTYIAKVKELLPHCAVLVNNASVFERREFFETDEAFYDHQMDVNLKAPFFMTQAFAKAFDKGAIVNLLDTDIVQEQGSHFAYMLSKKALADFTKLAANAIGPYFTINGVCPGCILPSDQNEESYEEKIEALIPLKSNPDTSDIAQTVYWLASQKHITGQLIFVDGGKHVL